MAWHSVRRGIGAALESGALLGLFLLPMAARAEAAASFVGSAKCTSCHVAQATAWQGSHHAQAMQVANAQTVLGAFSAAKPGGLARALGGVTRLFRRDDKYFAAVELPGKPAQEYQIRYTFGVYPLQQYLVDFPGGRLQALSVAWDARPAAQGGQHWFDLHPQGVKPGDPLHWTGRDSNWNFMCAACHSTNLRKNYSLQADSYQTTWTDLDVACEACHGPGSEHLQWAASRAQSGGKKSSAGPLDISKGLSVALHAGASVQWGFWSPGQRIASPHGALADARAQSQVCFACHARRQALSDGGTIGAELLNDYLPQLIEPGVYRADGQLDAEDFEFGSFIQSKMHAQGVTCTNCHDPHTLQLRAQGNALCAQCHRADVFDRPAHTHHSAQSQGAQCTSCHMPTKTYMGVDVRRDHSFRVPRPDLTQSIGVPNACTQCHKDKPAGWAASAIKAWGVAQGAAPGNASFAPALDAAWAGASATQPLLDVLAASPAWSTMARASAAATLATQDLSTPAARNAPLAAVHDADALVRLGAAKALVALPAPAALQVGAALLTDPAKAVRIEAARSLAGAADASTAPALAARLQSAVVELVGSEQSAAERPESHVNLAQIYARLGRDSEAEAELMTALRLEPRFVPAMVNLADLYRVQGREAEAEHWLRQALATDPRAAEPAHALGLLEVRSGQLHAALEWLKKAVALDPVSARYAYVYAVALSESGAHADAASVLKAARGRLPRDASLAQLQSQLQSAAPGQPPPQH